MTVTISPFHVMTRSVHLTPSTVESTVCSPNGSSSKLNGAVQHDGQMMSSSPTTTTSANMVQNKAVVRRSSSMNLKQWWSSKKCRSMVFQSSASPEHPSDNTPPTFEKLQPHKSSSGGTPNELRPKKVGLSIQPLVSTTTEQLTDHVPTSVGRKPVRRQSSFSVRMMESQNKGPQNSNLLNYENYENDGPRLVDDNKRLNKRNFLQRRQSVLVQTTSNFTSNAPTLSSDTPLSATTLKLLNTELGHRDRRQQQVVGEFSRSQMKELVFELKKQNKELTQRNKDLQLSVNHWQSLSVEWKEKCGKVRTERNLLQQRLTNILHSATTPMRLFNNTESLPENIVSGVESIGLDAVAASAVSSNTQMHDNNDLHHSKAFEDGIRNQYVSTPSIKGNGRLLHYSDINENGQNVEFEAEMNRKLYLECIEQQQQQVTKSENSKKSGVESSKTTVTRKMAPLLRKLSFKSTTNNSSTNNGKNGHASSSASTSPSSSGSTCDNHNFVVIKNQKSGLTNNFKGMGMMATTHEGQDDVAVVDADCESDLRRFSTKTGKKYDLDARRRRSGLVDYFGDMEMECEEMMITTALEGSSTTNSSNEERGVVGGGHGMGRMTFTRPTQQPWGYNNNQIWSNQKSPDSADSGFATDSYHNDHSPIISSMVSSSSHVNNNPPAIRHQKFASLDENNNNSNLYINSNQLKSFNKILPSQERLDISNENVLLTSSKSTFSQNLGIPFENKSTQINNMSKYTHQTPSNYMNHGKILPDLLHHRHQQKSDSARNSRKQAVIDGQFVSKSTEFQQSSMKPKSAGSDSKILHNQFKRDEVENKCNVVNKFYHATPYNITNNDDMSTTTDISSPKTSKAVSNSRKTADCLFDRRITKIRNVDEDDEFEEEQSTREETQRLWYDSPASAMSEESIFFMDNSSISTNNEDQVSAHSSNTLNPYDRRIDKHIEHIVLQERRCKKMNFKDQKMPTATSRKQRKDSIMKTKLSHVETDV